MGEATIVQPISAEDAKAMLDRGEAVAVDVREPMELATTGKIPDALALPYSTMAGATEDDLHDQLAELHHDRPVILYCASGKRAEAVGQMLLGLGYTKAFNLGGLKDWTGAGLPVEDVDLD